MQDFKAYLLDNIASDLAFKEKSFQDLLSESKEIEDKENKNKSKKAKKEQDILPPYRIEIYPHGKYLVVERDAKYDIGVFFNYCLSKGIMVEHKFLSDKIKRNQKNIIRLGDHKKNEKNDAVLKIHYDRYRITIYGEIILPKVNGCIIAKEEIISKLKREKINLSFIVTDNIEQLFISQFYYQKKMIIAQGILPVPDKPAYFENFILKAAEKASEQEEHNKDKIYPVKKDQVILQKRENIEGKDGVDLFDRAVAREEVKNQFKFPNIENTYNDVEGGKVLSKIDGHMVLLDNDLIEIKPVLKVDKDVIVHDKMIQTKGSVEIYGSLSDNKVEAGGNVIIHGTVENSQIIADGEILVMGGVIDNKKQNTILESSKQINVKFAQRVTLKSDGDVIFQEYLKKCNVYTLSSIISGRGEISGGRYIALNKIETGFLGSAINHSTTLYVGINPILMEQLDTIQKNVVFIRKKIELDTAKLENREDKELLDRINEDKENLQESLNKIVELKKNIFEEKSFGQVAVKQEVYKGTVVNCGNKQLVLKNDMQKVLFRNIEKDDYIVVEEI